VVRKENLLVVVPSHAELKTVSLEVVLKREQLAGH
jgi:hypothetical protein